MSQKIPAAVRTAYEFWQSREQASAEYWSRPNPDIDKSNRLAEWANEVKTNFETVCAQHRITHADVIEVMQQEETAKQKAADKALVPQLPKLWERALENRGALNLKIRQTMKRQEKVGMGDWQDLNLKLEDLQLAAKKNDQWIEKLRGIQEEYGQDTAPTHSARVTSERPRQQGGRNTGR